MRVTLGDGTVEVERVFCIGRNYADHVREMGGEGAGEPVIFMKPAQSLVPVGAPIRMPAHGRELHHEGELVLLLDPRRGEPGWDDVAGVGLGIDLTLRDLQWKLKGAGLPWELAKSFEGSAPIGSFVPRAAIEDPEALEFELTVDGERRQHGRVANMIHPVPAMLRALGAAWSLRRGDLVFTGTPEGVGPLSPGQRVEIASAPIGRFGWDVR